MSDKPNGAGTGDQESPPPPLVVLAQYVKDLSFENPNAPQSLMAGQPQPQVSIGFDVNVQAVEENIFEVMLQARCEAKQADKTAFIIELAYGGLFQLNGVPEEHIAPVLMIEAPRLLFPFARAIVADVTRDGGYPPLLLAPLDFVSLFRHKAEQQQQQAPAKPAAQPPF